MDITISTTPQSFLPHSFLQGMWLCGLYHPHVSASKRHVGFRAHCLSLLSSTYGYAVTALFITLPVLNLADYVRYSADDIATLQFFALVRLVNNSSDLLLGSLSTVVMFLYRKSVVRVFQKFLLLDTSLMPVETAVCLRKRVYIFVPLWICTWVSALCLAILHRYWLYITDLGRFLSPAQFLGLSTTWGFAVIFSSFCGIVSAVASLSSQLLYFVLVVALANMFACVHGRIRAVKESRPESSSLCEVLRNEFRVLRFLQTLTIDVNDAFGFLILLDCVRDMVALVTVIGQFLHPLNRQEEGETADEFAERMNKLSRRTYWEWTIVFMALANGMLRVGVCLYCSARVKTILRLLRTIRDEYEGTEVEADCIMILSEIDVSTGGISAAGLKYINLEYVANVVGTWITYGILVFQTRDADIGDVDSVRTKDLYRLMDYLEKVTQNESATMLNFIQQHLNVTR